jgi:translation initiation factor 2B subunit (eIF-2B alpha/beta/delta family)
LNKKVASHPSVTQRAIDDIAFDNRSGAAEILIRAGEVFHLLAQSEKEMDALDQETARNLVIKTCVALIKAQPRMAMLANLADRVATKALSDDQPTAAAARSAQEFIRGVEAALKVVTDSAALLIKDGSVVLTHSRSSTVLAAFKKARLSGRDFSVVATESRPGFEGRHLAASLAEQGVSVSLVADAAAALELSRADIALVGADMITPQVLINKIGTRMIALAARELNRPLYALSDTSKLINDGALSDGALSNAGDDRHNADELWPNAPDGVEVINRYFEPTPLSYFTKIITEDGLLDPAEVRLRAEDKRLNKALT